MRQFVRASCTLSLTGLVASLGLAAEPMPPMAPPLALARAAAQAKAPSARLTAPAPRRGAARKAATTADSAPPVVSSFSLPASVTLTRYGQDMPIAFKASDDLAGLGNFYAVIGSPSGNQQLGIFLESVVLGETLTDRRVGQWVYPNVEPGIWKLLRVGVCDLAQNCQEWDGDTQLRALKGRHQVEVKNALYDVTPPTLSRSVLSLRQVAGVGTIVEADVVALDAGDPRASGATQADFLLCQLNASDCLTLQGSNRLPDQSEAKLRSSRWLKEDDGIPAGVYHIKEVMLVDYFGNLRTYTSTMFGGETDFTGLFNVTSLSLP